MEQMPNNGTYITSNILEVTFLSFKGFNYKVDKSDKASVKFFFQDLHGIIDSLLKEFWAGSKELQLLDKHREIKKITVFDGYRKNHYRNDSNR